MKWYRELQAVAAEVARDHRLNGFKIEHGGKHLKVRLAANNGERIVTACATPSDLRTIHNVRRDLRHAARSLTTPRPRVPIAAETTPLVETPEPIIVADAPPIAPAGPDFLYHFTTSAKLHYIIEAGELRPVHSKYLWATTLPDGDRCALGYHHDGAKAYRHGAIARVRFTMPLDGFRPWREVVDADVIPYYERLAREIGQDTRGWYAKRGPLSLDECYGAHGPGYNTHHWIELGPTDTSEANVAYVNMIGGEDPGLYCAVNIGRRFYYLNCAQAEDAEYERYVVGSMDADAFLSGFNIRSNSLVSST